MQRYFVNKEQFDGDKVTIIGDDVHHITKVLRYSPNDKIICSNGVGQDVIAEIMTLEPKQVICKIIERIEETREPNVKITLAQALPKSDKMELIIQKGTEIGVSSFLPFTSERTIVQLNEKKENKKFERWEKIAKEAAEQSHRSIIPQILPVHTFKQLINFAANKLTLIAYENENTNNLYEILKENAHTKEILLIIGPEGGFTEKEVAQATENGIYSISLGKRILRTETAGLVGVANIIYHLEEAGF